MSVTADQVTAVVLAGGFGTRIKHLLGELPKPMAPVLDRPFVEWVVRYLAKQGIRRVVLSTGYLADKVADHFLPQPVPGVEVTCVPETSPLGTGGGFLHAATISGNRPSAWLVCNGDSLALAPLPGLLQSISRDDAFGALLAVPMKNADRYGTVQSDSSGNLIGFLEKRPGSGNINAGVYLFRAEALERFPSQRPLSFETDVFPALIHDGATLKVEVTQAHFLDIGTPESLPQAGQFISTNAHYFA